MKQNELKKCHLCQAGVAKNGKQLIFFRVTLERFIIDIQAVQRRHGLEMLMQSAVLAGVLGLNEDIALPVGEPVIVLICLDCIMQPYGLLQISEDQASGSVSD